MSIDHRKKYLEAIGDRLIFMILKDPPAQLPAVPTLSHGRHLFRQNIVWTLGFDLSP